MLILVRNDTTTRVNEIQWESNKEEIQSEIPGGHFHSRMSVNSKVKFSE